MRTNLVAIGVILLLAGCTTPLAEELPSSTDLDSPPESVGEVGERASTGVQSGAVEAPNWTLGTWWTFRIGSTFAPAREITVVVVGADDTSYALAATTEMTALEPVWWHLPPIGVLGREDLGWEAHDAPMSLLRFPFTDGSRWTGAVEGIEAEFAARRLPSGAFEVGGMGEDRLMIKYVYDPSFGQFTNASLMVGETNAWSTLDLVAAGTGWNEPSFLPMFDDAFMGGFAATEPTPLEQFEVPQEVTYVMVGCLAEGLVGDLRVQIVPSVGESFSCGNTFTAPGSAMRIVAGPGAPGTWRIVPSMAGSGSVFIEASNVWLLSCEPGEGNGLLLKPHGNCRMP